MARPSSILAVDLMMELPAGKAGMGMREARKLMRGSSSDEFTHHPAQYLFKDAGDRMDKVLLAGCYPGLSYERIFGEMDDLPLNDDVWPKFLRENAKTVYKLDGLFA
ncbi:MAG: hypothetical protein ABJP34_02425 [Erythrobacter sp.]